MLSIKLANLYKMSPEERSKTVNKLVEATKLPDGFESKKALQNQIRFFENKYQMTTEQMIAQLTDGSINESADHAEWIILNNLMKRCT